MGDADSVLILGPGEANREFKKRLNTKKFPVLAAEVETADKMTDRQIAANVRQHFESVPGQGKEATAPRSRSSKKLSGPVAVLKE